MLEKLIIWITDTDALQARWLVLDAQGNRVGFPQQGSLDASSDAATNRRVIVMLPGERILAASAHVPGSNARRILQAAPYALEDRLAGDVERLHVALLAQHKDNESDFLVVDREWLADLLTRLGDIGVQPDALWPDYLGIPDRAGATRWLITADQRLLSRNGWRGFATPASDAAFLYAHREDESPVELIMIGGDPVPAALEELETTRLADSERAFTELAATVASLAGPGLLQGAFRRKREGATDWQRLRWPATAAAALLLLALAQFGVDTWQLQREHALLEKATRELFQQALPGNQRMVDPRYQIEQALGAASSDSLLLDYLGNVAVAVQEIPNARLNGFNYRNNYLEFSVTVPNATTLEQLRGTLAQRVEQTVDVQSANSVPDGLEGRVMLGGGDTQ